MSYAIYSYPKNPRVYKALIAAKLNGVEVEYPPFEFGKDNKTKQFLKKNPQGKVPVLDTPDGPVWESNAIARYCARLNGDKANLFGKNAYEEALVNQWVDFVAGEIDLPAGVWIYPIMGFIPNNDQATRKAKADVRKALGTLNTHLEERTFLVGEQITLADIVVSCHLYWLYTMVLDKGFRKQFVHTNRWFQTCVNHPVFVSVVGKTTLCEKMKVAPKAPQPAGKKQQQQKPQAKKAPAKPQQQAKPAPKKQANPLDLLPKSKLDLEEWKRVYSNASDTKKDAMPWFWENYDQEGYSIWFSDYKYNDENAKMFMTSNLIGGFCQRLDRLRKYGFGNILIFGDEPKLEISGCWLFRGQDIPQEMKDCDDSEHYNWVKADVEKQKSLIEDYWAWAGTFEGKPGSTKFNDQGKVYK